MLYIWTAGADQMNNNVSEIYVFIITGILLFGLLAGFIIFFVVAYYKKQQQNSREKQLLQTKFNEDLLTSTIEIQEKAFDDISRELHDNVGQQLSAASIYLNLLMQEAGQDQNVKLQTCREIISNSLQDIRHISQTLLGDKITQVGFIASLRLELSKINKLGIGSATLHTSDESLELDPRKEIILFRIVQEAVNNATKHAPESEIHISIQKEEDQLKISIKDTGQGFDTSSNEKAGVGLINMESRAKTIGAQFTLTSKLKEGTQINIIL
ncbi:sensor histidine kinase [Niabella yanshanensis]|uniref:histidine kinase n=2 Tax=Niabella yanshanensis TaxID=577386 RepID=A0ABZ0W5M1_9BACT|nr:sensor histidine kinase [Niabella yanshanensis]WQD38481.1 sensor histidine kinase [Niabella yanshanensis]